MYQQDKLSYEFNALEPYIDAQTMEIHYGKHHATYVEKLNKTLEDHPELANKPIDELISDIESLPEDVRLSVRNNGGGHSNHELFWKMMVPDSKKDPSGNLEQLLNSSFGSVQQFKEKFGSEALARFGSGWVWLVQTSNEDLDIYSTPNQDSPIMEGKKPLLGLDVWEHAYYLKYQNRRAEYIENWWNVVNWEFVEGRL